MKQALILLTLVVIGSVFAEDTPGFFLKVAKNVPRLGKRNNFFIKQGGKNVPRLGRRSGSSPIEQFKSYQYNHVQPFDSKFVLDFLTDEVLGEENLKFVSWNDLDKALESDYELKKKLTTIATEKEIEDLKKLVYKTSDNVNEFYGHIANTKPYQEFIPYGYDPTDIYKYNNVENDVYYYQKEKK